MLALDPASSTSTHRPPACQHHSAHLIQSRSISLSSHFRYLAIDVATRHRSVVAILAERIHDLKTALLRGCEACSCAPNLQDALSTAREGEKATFAEAVATLQAEVRQLRRVLFASVVASDPPAQAQKTTSVSGLWTRSPLLLRRPSDIHTGASCRARTRKPHSSRLRGPTLAVGGRIMA